MKNYLSVRMFVVFTLIAGLTAGCGQQAATSQDAIEQSKAKVDVKAQVDYLVGQANSFISSQKFDEAINVAKYILAELDKDSQQAQSIIEKAKAEMQKVAQQKLDQMKAEANKAVSDAKSGLGSLGK